MWNIGNVAVLKYAHSAVITATLIYVSGCVPTQQPTAAQHAPNAGTGAPGTQADAGRGTEHRP